MTMRHHTEPIRVGVMLENVTRSPDHPVFRGARLRVDEWNAAPPRDGRPIELVFVDADGAHEGHGVRCIDEWQHLADDASIIATIGPGITDNCLPLLDPVERSGMPTLMWCGSDRARGDWCFQFQWGSLPDESDYLVRAIAAMGRRRVGVLRTGIVGDGYWAAFEAAASLADVEVVACVAAETDEVELHEPLASLRADGADTVVYLGMGASAMAFGRVLHEIAWDVPRLANIAMLTVAVDTELATQNEGIVWVDQYDPDDPVRSDLDGRYRETFGVEPPATGHLGVGYDMMTLLTAGLERAPVLTRAGMRAGLELVRQLPCATGGPHIAMGFGPYDRAALKGPDLFVYRTIRDGLPASFRLLGAQVP